MAYSIIESAKLLVKLHGHGSRTIDLARDSFTIGRKVDNDLPIDDHTVSSHHAKIVTGAIGLFCGRPQEHERHNVEWKTDRASPAPRRRCHCHWATSDHFSRPCAGSCPHDIRSVDRHGENDGHRQQRPALRRLIDDGQSARDFRKDRPFGISPHQAV